jgi:hypothetical protein
MLRINATNFGRIMLKRQMVRSASQKITDSNMFFYEYQRNLLDDINFDSPQHVLNRAFSHYYMWCSDDKKNHNHRTYINQLFEYVLESIVKGEIKHDKDLIEAIYCGFNNNDKEYDEIECYHLFVDGKHYTRDGYCLHAKNRDRFEKDPFKSRLKPISHIS